MTSDNLTALFEVGRHLAENRSTEALLDYALDAALEMFDAEYGYVLLIEPDGGLNYRAMRSRGGSEGPDFQKVSRSIVERVVFGGEDTVLSDAITDAQMGGQTSVMALGLRSVICVALVAQGERLGALYLENRSRPAVFSTRDMGPLRIFAAQMATALHNAMINDQLEARVAERTAELASMVEDLDAFAATVAHDLKSPLGTIVGYANLLLDMGAELPPERHDEMVGVIMKSGQRMAAMITDLLTLARIRQETEVNRAEPLRMAELVQQAQERLRHHIEESGAQIRSPGAWPVVLGYPAWVEEVWANYLSNAIKYGGTPPRIDIGAEPVDAYSVRFWVRDNGKGLSEEQAESLFKSFKRLNQDGRVEGHGLGLSIVKRIIERQGGEVGVYSLPGQGATFWFTLPGLQG